MTSQLNVDTIVDKAGSGGTNVKIANNAVTVSEGGSATTTTVQGLAKAHINFTGITTTAIRDSFNISSLTDAGTGVTIPITYTNNMNHQSYTGSYFQNGATGTAYNSFNNGYVGGFGTRLTASFGVYSHNNSGGTDAEQNDVVIQGDLA